ncbi:MAG: ion transporter [Bacteroidota bacterium]
MLTQFFDLISSRNRDDKFRPEIELGIIVLICLNVFLIVLESFPSIREANKDAFFAFEVFSVVVFTAEYVIRLAMVVYYHPNSRWRTGRQHVFSFMSLIDLLSILPFYLPFVLDLRFMRMLRLLRIVRILKLKRHITSFTLIVEVIREKREELSMTIFATSLLLLFAAALMYSLEGEAQPDNFPDILSTLWWAVATLTTVGYGDVYPITALGRLLSGVIALLGIGLVALPTGIISAAFLEKVEERKEFRKQQKKTGKAVALPVLTVCPHCGKSLHDPPEKISMNEQVLHYKKVIEQLYHEGTHTLPEIATFLDLDEQAVRDALQQWEASAKN